MTTAELTRTRARMAALERAFGFARSLVMYYGQPWRTRQLRRHYGALIRPGDIVFDVGAHVGNRTRCWARLGALVIAVEPQPRFARWLRWQFRGDARVTVVEVALGARGGLATLYQSPRTPTVSTLSRDWIEAVTRTPGFASVAWSEPHRIIVTTLDSLIERFGAPRFCKIDVEGYEAEVLRGLSIPIPLISVEFVPAAIGVALAALERLETLGSYRYNVSLGERLEFVWPDWQGAGDLRAWLEARRPTDPSGDIHARLEA